MKLFPRLSILGLVLLTSCAAGPSVAQPAAEEHRHGWAAYPNLESDEGRYATPEHTGGRHPANRRRHGWGAYPNGRSGEARDYATTRPGISHPADRRRHTWETYPDCPC